MEQLKRKHADLEEALRREEMRPMPDDAVISRIKKEKLRLKDAMASMENMAA
jgi:hypothetical protein